MCIRDRNNDVNDHNSSYQCSYFKTMGKIISKGRIIMQLFAVRIHGPDNTTDKNGKAKPLCGPIDLDVCKVCSQFKDYKDECDQQAFGCCGCNILFHQRGLVCFKNSLSPLIIPITLPFNVLPVKPLLLHFEKISFASNTYSSSGVNKVRLAFSLLLIEGIGILKMFRMFSVCIFTKSSVATPDMRAAPNRLSRPSIPFLAYSNSQTLLSQSWG